MPLAQPPAVGAEVDVIYKNQIFPVSVDDPAEKGDIVANVYDLGNGIPTTASGFSLRRVLETAGQAAGFQLVSIVSVDVDAIPGTRQIRKPRFENGPPIFFERDGGTNWILPGSPGELFSFDGKTPRIEVNYGVEFEVKIESPSSNLRAGEEIPLKATVSGPQPGERLTFAWRFGDGQVDLRNTTGSVKHEFKEQRSYQVSLEVTGLSGGGSAQTTIVVGEAKKPETEKDPDGKKPEHGNNHKKDGAGNGGGKGGNRDHDGDRIGNHHGAVAPRADAGDGGGTGAGTGTEGVPDTKIGSGPNPISGPSKAAPGSGGSDSRSKSGDPRKAGLPVSDPFNVELVSGLLVDPTAFTPTSASSSEPSDVTEAKEGGSGIGGPALGFAGTIILLALGSSAELLAFRRE